MIVPQTSHKQSSQWGRVQHLNRPDQGFSLVFSPSKKIHIYLFSGRHSMEPWRADCCRQLTTHKGKKGSPLACIQKRCHFKNIIIGAFCLQLPVVTSVRNVSTTQCKDAHFRIGDSLRSSSSNDVSKISFQVGPVQTFTYEKAVKIALPPGKEGVV